MKNSKKILGVALALIMIFNVFAVGTFAAFPGDAAVNLTLSTDKTTYAPGEEVIVTVYQQVIPEVGDMISAGTYEIAYDSSAISPLSTVFTNESLVNDHGFVINSELTAGYDDSMSAVSAGTSGIDADGATAYGWDSAVTYIVAANGAGTKFDCSDAAYPVFTVKMKIPADAANGTYTIGFNKPAYENYVGFCADATMGGLYGTNAAAFGFPVANMYEYGTCTFTVGAAAPAEKEVKHADTMAQWADQANGKINVGLVGKFLTEDIAIDYEGNKLTNVAKVGAKVTINGTEIEDYTEFVYDVNGDGSELWFRAVVTGVDYDAKDAAGDISVVYVVEMTDGTKYESDAYTTTVAEVYAEACGNGMPAFGA